MKKLFTLLIILAGGIVLYYLYIYALNSTPQLEIKESNNTVAKSEGSIITSYINKAMKKELNRTKEHKKLSITDILKSDINKTKNSIKNLFDSLENSEENNTIEGVLELNTTNVKKKLTKEEKKILKAKEEPLKIRLKALNAKFGNPIYIRIFKKSKELEVWIKPKNSKKYKLLKDYKICYYSGRLGPKLKEGDGVSPEGFYSVSYGALNPHSSYHLSFNLGFPNEYDINHGRTGSYLMVHGKCVSVGCYAMGDKNIDEIYKLVKESLLNSQSEVMVHIFPFRLEKKELAKYRKNRWYKFWLNLKEGYDTFNKTHIPPTISVDDLKYVVTEANK